MKHMIFHDFENYGISSTIVIFYEQSRIFVKNHEHVDVKKKNGLKQKRRLFLH